MPLGKTVIKKIALTWTFIASFEGGVFKKEHSKFGCTGNPGDEEKVTYLQVFFICTFTTMGRARIWKLLELAFGHNIPFAQRAPIAHTQRGEAVVSHSVLSVHSGQIGNI